MCEVGGVGCGVAGVAGARYEVQKGHDAQRASWVHPLSSSGLWLAGVFPGWLEFLPGWLKSLPGWLESLAG